MAPKTLIYKGEVFNLYKGHRYYERRVYLHKQVWIDTHGKIPAGYHIHHKNDDATDNSIGNLECLSPSAHARHHINTRPTMRAKQKIWANSKEGRAILSAAMQKCRENTPSIKLACRNCGKYFQTTHPAQKFCSVRCQEDNNWFKKKCAVCGKGFMAKHHRTREVQTCSYSCGWTLRRKKTSL